MKKQKRYISLFLALVLLMCTLGTAPSFAARFDVAYSVTGEMSGGDLVLHIAVTNIRAFAGRLALSFDTDKLELKSTASLGAAISAAQGVTLTTEALHPSVLLSNQKGHAMFAWHISGNTPIDATGSDREIASIALTLKDGVTESDFNRNTIGLYYMNTTMAPNWTCSAEILDSNDSYKNTSVDSSRLCGLNLTYPNSDVIPIVTYAATVRISDTNGNPIRGAFVSLDAQEAETDANGSTTFEMADGTYAYHVSAPGYETKSGYLIINGSAEELTLALRTDAEFANYLASNLELYFAEGDSAGSVTASIGLPTTGEHGETITWQSSNTRLITNDGLVLRPEDDTRVILTAYLTYNGAQATHEFPITVKSRLTVEEKNAEIVKSDTEALAIGFAPGDDADAVTTDLTLPGTGVGGCAITWSSSQEEVIDSYGTVTRPQTDTSVTLTAMVMRGTASQTKEFNVKVIGAKDPSAVNNQEIVDRVINALAIGYTASDNENRVTGAIILPTVGVEETEITWESSHPAVVTGYGAVIRQAEDVAVTLTATAKRGDAEAQKTFNIRVVASPTIPVNPGNGQQSLIEKINEERQPEKEPTEDPADPSVTEQGFQDIASVPWAQEAILALSQRGVIKGTSATTFEPDASILRCDFITLLMRMLNMSAEITAADAFADVPANAYYYESVTMAKSLGLITGVGENRFEPLGVITRQDMFTMTYRALTRLNLAPAEAADLSGYADSSEISDYAYESVSHLVGAGYIKGDAAGLLNPNADTTRAETAVFLYRLEF